MPATSVAYDQFVRKKIACAALPVPFAPLISARTTPMLLPYVPATVPQSSELAGLLGFVSEPDVR